MTICELPHKEQQHRFYEITLMFKSWKIAIFLNYLMVNKNNKIPCKCNNRTLMVHIHWASHARNQWSHTRLQGSIFSPYCDSFWHKLSQYGKRILHSYVYHIVYYLRKYEALHEITDFVNEMLTSMYVHHYNSDNI